jgi:arylsulfatase A-like enzyme
VAPGQSETLGQAYERHFGKPRRQQAAPDAPNILLITSDQHHWMFMGYNDPAIKTPNLDRLTAMGTIFDRAYTPNPVSTPARASIITGMYPSQHGAYALGTKLDERVLTMGEMMQESGYRTALIGKAHFQPLTGTARYPSAEAYPMLQDFDFWSNFNGPFYGFGHVELARNHGDEAHVGQHYALWMEQNGAEEWRKWFRPPTGTAKAQYGAWNLPEKYHPNVWIARRTNAMIDRYADRGEKFFLWASFFDPHPPYLVPEPWASMYHPEDVVLPETFDDDLSRMPWQYRETLIAREERDPSRWMDDSEPFVVHGLNKAHSRDEQAIRKDMAIYYGMISFMDHQIGSILDKLEKKGILDSTLIVFTTDHGHLLGHHGLTSKGVFDYEDAVKLPFVAAYKDHIPVDRRTDAMLSLVDLAPTFLSYMGIRAPDCMSGVDQKAVWNGQAVSARDFVIVENRFQPTKFYVRTYIERRYKLTYDMNSDDGELFDLEQDPLEMHNLWDDARYRELKMRMLLRALQGDMRSEAGMPRIDNA